MAEQLQYSVVITDIPLWLEVVGVFISIYICYVACWEHFLHHKHGVHNSTKVSCLWMVTCAETSAEVEEGWGEWQLPCDGEERMNYGTFASSLVVRLHKVNFLEGSFPLKCVHWKNKLGLKQRVNKCRWIGGRHVLFGGARSGEWKAKKKNAVWHLLI